MRGHQRCKEAREDELRWRCLTDMNPYPLEEEIRLKNCQDMYDEHCKEKYPPDH